jgi:hypothetical protein
MAEKPKVIGDGNMPDFDWRAITPEDSPKTPMDMWAEPQHQDLSTAKLSVGDRAFNFSRELYDFCDGTEVRTGGSFDLLEAVREKPVALIFGSYT